MTRLAALALLLLAGCREPAPTTEDIAADAAADATDDAMAESGFEDRIADLETRVEQIEHSDDLQDANIDTLFSNDKSVNDFANDTEDRVATIEVRLGM
jgi:hypothetical protein